MYGKTETLSNGYCSTSDAQSFALNTLNNLRRIIILVFLYCGLNNVVVPVNL